MIEAITIRITSHFTKIAIRTDFFNIAAQAII
jgi:hypothetical protein